MDRLHSLCRVSTAWSGAGGVFNSERSIYDYLQAVERRERGRETPIRWWS